MFDDQGALKLDERIADLVRKITNLIRKSEAKLKEMNHGNAFKSEETEGIDKGKMSFVKKEIIENVQ